ncbi:hypothetical protein CHARACLAT_005647 [Characodon lateralis]|uniref:Uncharacterized protein n=1 Tax=Characodon lateralis TaxID=208331 RepID=A0ABU7DHS0_9TELE|nr:hypothetical protein [Characodon lateralis]
MTAERNISLSNWPGTALYICVRVCPCGCMHVCLDIQAAFEQPLHQRLVLLHRQCQLASGQQPLQWSYGQPHPCGRISDKKHTQPLSDSQRTRFLWTDRAANSTEKLPLPQTATGGQAHARLSCVRQMSPDESQGQSKAPKSPRRAPACFSLSLILL